MRTEAEFLQLVETKLAAAPPNRQKIGPRAMVMAASVAVLAALALSGAAVLFWRAGPPDELERTESGAVELDTFMAIAETACPIEERDLPVPLQQTWAGETYSITRTAEPLPVAESDLGAHLAGDLYAMRGVSTDYFLLCVKDGYWGYVNYDYRPASLAGLIADLGLAENLTFGSLYVSQFVDGEYQAWRVDGLDHDRLWTLLFAYPDSTPQALKVKVDPEAVVKEAEARGEMVTPAYDPTGQYEYDRTPQKAFSIGISVPKLGFNHIAIMLSDEDEGWLWTNLLASGNYFATSAELCDDILAYARAAGTWVNTTPDPNAEVTGIPE